MTDAEMYQKILAQVEALERVGVNYFDVEKEFFIIDSDNLPSVQTRFYGYSIQADGIYEADNLTPEAVKNLDGRGCYVYVEVRDGQITIKQDLNGCYGIYLFRHGNYFALSNSFFRLLDYIKFRYPLNINKDYVHNIVTDGLASIAYLETAVNEIQCTERNAILHVDVAKKFLHVELIDYKEQSLSIDSEEGIATLDSWASLWGEIIRSIVQHSQYFCANLSGGFDSRISLALLLNSGVDLEKVRIRSYKGNGHTYPEDYKIASQITAHYGFKLNPELPDRESLNYSLSDIFNVDFHTRQPFRSIPGLQTKKGIDKLYLLGGSNGETLRRHWQMTPKEFTMYFGRRIPFFPRALFGKFFASLERILERGFRAVCDKYHIQDKNSKDIPQYIHQEVRSRTHFGKGTLGSYFINIFILSPALDPVVRTLKLCTAECPDANLLMALIFARYQPDLLKFPFQGGRSIAPETIAYARKLNERFPRRVTSDKFAWGGVFNLQPHDTQADSSDDSSQGGFKVTFASSAFAKKTAPRVADLDIEDGLFHLQPRDTQAEKILTSGRNNPKVPDALPEFCLVTMFEDAKTRDLFCKYFDEELYQYTATFYNTHAYNHNRRMYSLVGITKVLEAVETSRGN